MDILTTSSVVVGIIATVGSFLLGVAALRHQARPARMDTPSAWASASPTPQSERYGGHHLFLSIENHTGDIIEPVAITTIWPWRLARLRSLFARPLPSTPMPDTRNRWRGQIDIANTPLVSAQRSQNAWQFLVRGPMFLPSWTLPFRLVYIRRGKRQSVPISFLWN